MLKKFLVLLLSYQLSFSFVTTDPTSYVYFMQQIQQMTKMIDAATTQIKTLGGIRTAMDETKRQIYNAKDNLEGAFSNLQSAMKDLQEATSNAEVKSLFDLGRDSIKTNSTEGILYKNITNEIQSYFDNADDAIMKNFDKAKLQAYDEEMKKLTAALSSNSLEDAKKNLETLDYAKISKNLLLRDYLASLQGKSKEGYRNYALKMNNDIWNKYFLPNEEEKEKRKARQEKVAKYISYIENSSDIYQQTQTTNMILAEILTVLNEEYKSAISYRNAMSLLYLSNSDNKSFLDQIKKNREVYGKLKKSQDVQIDDIGLSRIQNLPKSNPYGVGFRPFK
ncbi:hypothetical protein [Arcobacter sp. F2176]|uniref:hypothetical protein n=1 Tax=Arcobacter sp. F2176 TaxID=2044511 RepID=UPI00100B2005|nr:hypothetical protein [Arcobacter sp. F2176]RXJ82176.1 hypothetical protein CRU95_04625 [Arcobacter sp. F2176]